MASFVGFVVPSIRTCDKAEEFKQILQRLDSDIEKDNEVHDMVCPFKIYHKFKGMISMLVSDEPHLLPNIAFAHSILSLWCVLFKQKAIIFSKY
ncbi:hypothetical protein GWI33_009279 [Rhynchophorus ferrugineus]|uniref:Uncharacterized protein n=1 Tax=Rhynchophorus ferrugineus TaxID=354439 RepID=A0A834IEU3_RHYFE|nr:hypothetical protein GWI33_009279 [Rhynchophorus ferrugineus]